MQAAPFDHGAMLSAARVRVTAPARLHLGFLDLAGDLGRRFGSLGLALEEIGAEVALARSGAPSAAGPDAARAQDYLRAMAARFDLTARVALRVEAAVPAHVGLGSGTALALAVGAGLARLEGVAIAPADIARALGRGRRSGIGVAAFAQGGVVLDGGARADGTGTPPVLARHEFPEAWRVILVEDPQALGKHGRDEIAAFARLPPFPPARAAALCRLVLMQALPALAERDIRGFGAAVTAVQEAVGDHFAPAQGGRFASPAVAEALAWLAAAGAAGIGQSSWGPTGFALVGDAATAEGLCAAAGSRAGARLRFRVTRGRNRGAAIAEG
jgi:beta-RFAP synthase